LLRLDACFEAWAHESQLPPQTEGWRVWLLMAGRGFGKTRAGAEWVHGMAHSRPGVRIALAGATIADARSIMVEGVSGLLAVAALHRQKLSWEPSLGRIKWPNGSEAQLFSGDNADGLRGPEHDLAWCDELAKWGEADEAWDNLQFGLREGAGRGCWSPPLRGRSR
jgi:phage terminase large subunit-like protein